MLSPGLLDDVAGPSQPAHVSCAVVVMSKRYQGAEDRVRQHEQERETPGGRDYLGGVGLGLPSPRAEWIADGAVALQ